MPNESPDDFVRVRDKDTGYHLSVRRSALPYGNFQVLKQDAVDPTTGFVIPPDHTPGDGTSAADKKES